MTIKAEEEIDAAPSAPPISELDFATTSSFDIPTATAVPVSSSTTSEPPRPQASAAVPSGVVKKTTTTYADGRQVTVTEYVSSTSEPTPSMSAGAVSAPAANSPQFFVPRNDLGHSSVSMKCPYCSHTGSTKLTKSFGDCTWISVIIMLIVFIPLFWVPFVFPSCQDTKHQCRKCGRIIGESNSECCS